MDGFIWEKKDFRVDTKEGKGILRLAARIMTQMSRSQRKSSINEVNREKEYNELLIRNKRVKELGRQMKELRRQIE